MTDTPDLKAIRERTHEGEYIGGVFPPVLRDHVRSLRDARSDVHALLDIIDAMVGALLAVEWSERISGESAWHECPGCHNDRRQRSKTPDRPHDPGCSLDAALTTAGFPDQASRESWLRSVGTSSVT